jgi:hypothetical protein
MRLTEKTFKTGMYTLGIIFDRDVTDPEFNSLYWLALYEYPDDAVKNAFAQALKTCKWFPKPADLIEAIAGARKNMGKLAWAELMGKLDTWGGMYNHVWETDGATAEAVKAIGGYSHLSGLRFWEVHKLEDAFLAAYDRAVSAGSQHSIGKVIGKRDRDWKTGELVPLTVIQDGERKSVVLPAGAFKAVVGDREIESEESLVILPSETEKRMADLMIAKRLQ